MENEKVVRTWGAAVVVAGAVIAIVGAALSISAVARAQTAQLPPAVVQWQPQTILEAKSMAKINEDNKVILAGLQALAKDRGMTAEAIAERFKNTYLQTPRLWTPEGWVEGWGKVAPLLKTLIGEGSQPAITSVSGVLKYLPAAATAKTPAEDIDAVLTVTVTFSASPGDNILSGQLCHSRVCMYYPAPCIPGGVSP